MGRYAKAKCRLCRREGAKLFLKGERCDSSKCSIERRDFPPGMRSFGRRKTSEYNIRLREKQKLKRFYGVMERQFRRYFSIATKQKGVTGENLLRVFELRLDNIVYKLGFARSRSEARQIVAHGHIFVNGNKVDIPSRSLKKDDRVAVKDNEKSAKIVKKNIEVNKNLEVAPWLTLDKQTLVATVLNTPSRDDISIPVNEQLIVELCSR